LNCPFVFLAKLQAHEQAWLLLCL